MKKLFLYSICILTFGCGQEYNSNYNDGSTYGNSGISPGSTLYNAYAVMQNKCFTCHGPWAEYKTSSAWINAGKIVSGSVGSSQIYNSLRNNGGQMPPPPYAALTAQELSDIEAWINNP